jgi:oxygen-independent coproporphyrinogen-3 oxidase
MLEVDQDSRLGSEVIAFGTRYGAPEVPDDDQVADFYEAAVERLAGMGITRYEISNFARAGFESIHNLKYWLREPYLGCGADAHSFDGGTRWQNCEDASDYIRRITAGGSAVTTRTPADATSERFFLGLRLDRGIPGPWHPFEGVVEQFLGDGLLERQGACLRLTPRGVLLSNEVFAEFLGVATP